MNPDPTDLGRLHDLVVPPGVPWWPPAPGWDWVLGFVALAFFVFACRAFLSWQHNRYRREALAELARLEAACAVATERAGVPAGIAELLKRAALSAWPRTEVASLHGAAWRAFLDRTGGVAGDQFCSETGAALESAAYDSRQAARLDDDAVLKMCALARRWLKHHRVTKTATAGGAGSAFLLPFARRSS